MLNSAIAFLARIAIGKQLVAGIAAVHNKLDGNKSEISLGLLALVHALKIFGVIPAPVADTVEAALSAILPVVLADRFSKVKEVVDSVIPAPVAPAPVDEKPA